MNTAKLYAGSTIPDNVVQLEELLVDSFLQQAVKNHLPAIILFSKKEKTPPMFKSVALKFASKAEFAMYSKPGLNSHLVSQFTVNFG